MPRVFWGARVQVSTQQTVGEYLIFFHLIGHLHDARLIFYYYDQNPFRRPFIFKYGNLNDVQIAKALICTRKQNPERF